MLVQLSYKEELPEIPVKARRRPFMTAVAIICHFFPSIFLVRPLKLEVKFYEYFILIEQSTEHVQVKKSST